MDTDKLTTYPTNVYARRATPIADLYCSNSDTAVAVAHIFMSNNASFRRMKKAAKAVMATKKYTCVYFRDSGHLITPEATQSTLRVLSEMSPSELKANYHWPKLVAFYTKMNRLSTRLNTSA